MSDEPQPVGRFDWERLVDRAEMPKHVKDVAYVLAHYASRDGSNVHPGNELVADILDVSERTVEVNTDALEAKGWLLLVKRGGGRNGQGVANVYQLTDPGPVRITFRLDPNGVRLVPRKAGKKPGKKPDPEIEPKPTSDESPVDNSGPADLDPSNDPKPTSDENDFQPKWSADSTEVERGLNRSPLRTTTLDHTKTTTPRVLPLGDPLTSDSAESVEKPNGVMGDGVGPEAESPAVGDLDYARAQKILRYLSPLERDLLLSAARERLTAAGTPLKVRSLTIAAAAIHEIKESA